jgi:hypothetical protein
MASSMDGMDLPYCTVLYAAVALPPWPIGHWPYRTVGGTASRGGNVTGPITPRVLGSPAVIRDQGGTASTCRSAVLHHLPGQGGRRAWKPAGRPGLDRTGGRREISSREGEWLSTCRPKWPRAPSKSVDHRSLDILQRFFSPPPLPPVTTRKKKREANSSPTGEIEKSKNRKMTK